MRRNTHAKRSVHWCLLQPVQQGPGSLTALKAFRPGLSLLQLSLTPPQAMQLTTLLAGLVTGGLQVAALHTVTIWALDNSTEIS